MASNVDRKAYGVAEVSVAKKVKNGASIHAVYPGAETTPCGRRVTNYNHGVKFVDLLFDKETTHPLCVTCTRRVTKELL